MPQSFIIAAPSSGSGKTSVTLGLLRTLKRQGHRVGSGKIGPDYIDPAFHAAAIGAPSLTFDPWSMQPARLEAQLADLEAEHDYVVLESAMGLFDGAADGSASTAKLAKDLGLPVVLVVDCKGMAGSVAALVHGFVSFDLDVEIKGLILNRVASARHGQMLKAALEPLGIPVLGALPRQDNLHLPSRHLGLVQAGDTLGLETKLESLADWVERDLSLGELPAASKSRPESGSHAQTPPLGHRIAIAKDAAFSFAYPHMLDDWRGQGAELSFFSPLKNEHIPSGCDGVYLPGGYPELHAEALSRARVFQDSLKAAAARKAWVYGECGGYMALGQAIVDAEGRTWPMAGLLDQTTRFDQPKRHLGYRAMTLEADTPLGGPGARFRGHEFHYSVEGEPGAQRQALFSAQDAQGKALGSHGQIKGTVFGSYLHLVDTR